MLGLSNLDLIFVGIAVAAIGILGFIVFFNNRKSSTNRAFLFFSLVSVLWSVINYLQYQISIPSTSFWILRIVIFLGVWHSFSFFNFCFVFPEESKQRPKWHKFFFLPAVGVISILTLTPLVFSRITEVNAGTLTRVENGPAIALVAMSVLFSVVGGIILLVRKTIKAEGQSKKQFVFVFYGMLFTFLLLMIFNFILPAFLNTISAIPLGPIFLLPFVVSIFYSISRYHLLNVKVISTEILAFILSIVTLMQLVVSGTIGELLLRSGIFILVLIFSILLIQSVNKEVTQREELQKLTKKLEVANKQLEKLSHFKTELLSLASHQIRSPIAAIKDFAALIIEGLYGHIEERTKEALNKIKFSADGLIELINTLLDVRKVEEGKMEYRFLRTDFKKIVNDVFTLLEPLAKSKQIDFTFKSSPKEFFVNADETKLKQVVQNLIDNAIKYTPKGFVHVNLKAERSVAILAINDSGFGIPQELIPHLFEEFIRDERVKKDIRGTGLGLYIARKIADAHYGKIWAESEGEEKGSTFYLSIPLIK
ncbi:MAG: ATP-binding protein [Patescibacteria group bacterium]